MIHGYGVVVGTGKPINNFVYLWQTRTLDVHCILSMEYLWYLKYLA